MASILGTQSGIYQPPRQRVLDANAQQADASGAGQAAAAAGGAGEAARATEATTQAAAPTVLDPTQVRSRIDGLIDGQLASGSLTGDQARVLKRVLGSGSADAASDPGDGAASAVSSDPAAASRTGEAQERQSPSEVLASFIRQLQTTQARTSGYASDGSSDGAKLTSSRLLDFNT